MIEFGKISTQVNIDVLNAIDKAKNQELKAFDILPIAAAPIFQLRDDDDITGRADIFSAVRNLKRKKELNYASYTYESLIEALKCRWIVNLTLKQMEKLLIGIKVIKGFDENGNVVPDDVFCPIYRKFVSNSNFQPLKYEGKKIFNATDNENLAVIHRMLEYPPFNGIKIWSWKCSPNDYKNEYPSELCCVGENEWFDKSFETISSLEELSKELGCSGKKGTVARAWWDFYSNIHEGDIVLYRDWKNDLVAGIGIFKGNYKYKTEKENNRSCRDVEWISTKHYPSPKHIGKGNTWPMEIDTPKLLLPLLPIISEAITTYHQD